MKLTLTKISLLLTCFAAPSFASSIYDCPEGDESFACKQKENVDAIWVDMNKTASNVVDNIMTAPESAAQAGCLDDIRSINTSIMTVDPFSIWSEVYQGIKDQLITQVCSAVEDRINEQTTKLAFTLEAPLGLGSVGVDQSYDIETFDELTNTRVQLSNREAKNKVVGDVFGDYTVPTAKHFTEKSMDKEFLETQGVSKRADRNKAEENIESIIDFNRLWKKESGNESK